MGPFRKGSEHRNATASRIIVSGIYRSGTSLVTELIRRWGAYAGDQEDLFQDEYGYLEHLALQRLNDELLNNNSRVPVPVEELLEKSQDPDLREHAFQILEKMDAEAKAHNSVAWVWKDPRLPLVLPFWSNIWRDVIYVIPVRHPVETIFSAAKMEGMEPHEVPLSAGFVYWQYCMLNVLTFTADSPKKLFVQYDQLLHKPQEECTRLSKFLDLHCSVRSEADTIGAMAGHVTLQQHHVHSASTLAEIDVTTKEQRALFNFLRVKTHYPDETFRREDFALYPGWREYLQTIDKLVYLTNYQESQEDRE